MKHIDHQIINLLAKRSEEFLNL
ncbi:uncharacterized protein METZ01_LOCUS58458 [marine metagenome]|uniref:Uncharacterized protein n=1 Tax=marine metagenome TaxID=408172 RepID=A0A381SQC4_9ZZZZ